MAATYANQIIRMLTSLDIKTIIKIEEYLYDENDILSLRKRNNKYSKQNISKDSKVSKYHKTMIKLLAISIIAQ